MKSPVAVMGAVVLRRIRWMAERLAWPEFLVLALLAFCCTLKLAVIEPLRRQIDTRSAIFSAREAQPERQADTRPPTRPDALEAFLAFLPGIEERDDQLVRLNMVLQQAGAELVNMELAHLRLAHLPVQRLALQMVLTASESAYPAVLHQLQAEFPNLSIDRVTLATMTGPAGTTRQVQLRIDASAIYRAKIQERAT